MRKLSPRQLFRLSLLSLLWCPTLNADNLTSLGQRPDWDSLDAYQQTITRAAFVSQLDVLYAPGQAWQETITIEDQHALIRTREGEAPYRLEFAPSEAAAMPPPRRWRKPAEALVPDAELPLTGWHIALDPGHIGGAYGPMEGRSWRIGAGPLVQEGDLVLVVAYDLKEELEALGATVTLVREQNAPITTETPESLRDEAESWLRRMGNTEPSPLQIQRTAERLFYRSSEIRARAERVNKRIHPDLILCLHLNATDFADYSNPEPVEPNHLHLLVNGAYSAQELAYDDVRYGMLIKLLSGTAEVEAAVASELAETMAEQTGLPAFSYGGPNAVAIAGEPYVWGRNLAANRLYACPVVFLEPYVANSRAVYPRIATELEAEQMPIPGGILEEYTHSVVDGLRASASQARASKE